MYPLLDENQIKAELKKPVLEKGLPEDMRQNIFEAAKAQALINNNLHANTINSEATENVIPFAAKKATEQNLIAASSMLTSKKIWFGLSTAALLVITVGLSHLVLNQDADHGSTLAHNTTMVSPTPSGIAAPPTVSSPIPNESTVSTQPNTSAPQESVSTMPQSTFNAATKKPIQSTDRPLENRAASHPYLATSSISESDYEAASYQDIYSDNPDIQRKMQQIQKLQSAGNLLEAVKILIFLQQNYPDLLLPESMQKILPVQESTTLSQKDVGKNPT
jgi:hypothetical protein